MAGIADRAANETISGLVVSARTKRASQFSRYKEGLLKIFG